MCRSMWVLWYQVQMEIRACYDPIFAVPAGFRGWYSDEPQTIVPSILTRMERRRGQTHAIGIWDENERQLLREGLQISREQFLHAKALRIDGNLDEDCKEDDKRMKEKRKEKGLKMERDVLEMRCEDIDFEMIQMQFLPWRTAPEIGLQFALESLELSELRVHIAQYLPLADRKACALVRKAWYDDFQPLIWERLSFHIPVQRTRSSSSSLDDQIQQRVREVDDIYKNAHLVKHLTVRIIHETAKELYEILLVRFDHLVTLEAWASDRGGWEALKNLIRRNERLRQVKLNDSSRHWCNIADPDLHTALSEGKHTQLRRLDITCETTVASLMRILEACPALDELIVDRSLATRSEIEQDGVFEKLEEEDDTSTPLPSTTTTSTSASTLPLQQFFLKANVSDPALIDLLKRSPRLWRLGFNAMTGVIHKGIRMLLQAGLLPNLKTVHFAPQFFSCPRHSDIMLSVPLQQLREVEIEDTYTDLIIALFERQAQTLERIRFSRVCNPIDFAGYLIHCPQLKQVEVSMTGGQTYADIRYLIASPWACLDLEVLIIESLGLSKEGPPSYPRAPPPEWILELTAEEKNEYAPGRPEWEQAQIVFMKRLGEMSKLRKFKIGDHESSLTWSLSTGFAYLAELSSLEEFDLGAGSKVDSIAELEFMKDCWPNLQKMVSAELAPGERKWLDENWSKLIVVETKAASGSAQG
ncbi:hypothetical protein BGX28_000157 [Mortierella sp. GBA30]|nr:hypothetical protein BGX28_000157 [Mortierella sp. GBA30]